MKRNRVLAVFSASFALAGVLTSLPATANAAAYYTYYPTAVQVNGSTVSAPGHITEKDPFGGANAQATSFLPIWYIDQALGKFNVKVSWSGATGILNLTTPSGMTVNYPPAPRPVTINSGTMVIQINGKPVTYAPRIAYYDEGSGGNGSLGILTTFVPVYYLEKSIGYMGVQTGWNGVDWTMDYGTVTPPVPSNETVKVAAAVAFAKAMGIQPDGSLPNPYSDVSTNEWQWIAPLVAKSFTYNILNTLPGNAASVQMGTSVFQPSSSTQFGTDVTTTEIDRAFQVASGWAIGHDSYLPGGSVTAFGNVVGVNNGLPSSGNLTMSDVSTLSANLTKIEKGDIALGNNQYQLVYRPQDPGSYWASGIPATVVSQSELKVIQSVNQTTISYLGGNNFETKAPDLAASNQLSFTGVATPPEQYSLDNGATWHTVSGSMGFNSQDLQNGGTNSPPSYVLIKDTQGAGGILFSLDYNGTWQIVGGGGLINENGTLVTNYR